MCSAGGYRPRRERELPDKYVTAPLRLQRRLTACLGGSLSGLCCAALLIMAWLVSGAVAAPADSTSSEKKAKIVGANACAECHGKEAEVWKNTHHHKTFRQMPRSKEARKIAGKLGIKRIKAEPLCQGCHFTATEKRGRKKVVSGISCESCHGAAEEWVKVHSEFSGKGNKKAESASEAKARWEKSVAGGMIRKDAFYDIAKNCYSCHVVPNEKLVNVGGHPAGSDFELVSWSQGEIRHNVWYNKGKKNAVASIERRRMIYLVGLSMELETALRAIAVATKFEEYAIRMAHRADKARKAMKAAADKLPDVPEVANIVAHGHSAGLKLDNKAALMAAADKVAAEAQSLSERYDGSKFGALDALIPKAEKFVGAPTGP